MFTPEFSSDERGEFVMLASHSLLSDEALQLSIEYNQARLVFGLSHMPAHLRKCRLLYDIRGQAVPQAVRARIQQAFPSNCTVEFKS